MFLSIHKSIVLIGTASKQFDVLKKRCSWKRQALKKASRSGSGAKETEAAQKDLEPSQQTFVGLQDVLKTSSRHVLKTSSTRLQRNNFTSSKTF